MKDGHTFVAGIQKCNGRTARFYRRSDRPRWFCKATTAKKVAVRFYRTTPLTSKYLVVAYKEVSASDGFVVTAYFARGLADWRKILWKL
jgi:hypothetical protein